MSLKDWFSIVSAVVTIFMAAGLPGLYLLHRRVFKPIMMLPQFMDQVDAIAKELRTNGGSSLKDVVMRMNDNVTRILARNRAISQLDPRPIFETDRDGLCVWVNRSYLRLVGLSMPELIGHGWKNILNVEDYSRVVTDWQSAVLEKREYFTAYQIIDSTGCFHHVTCHALPMFNEDTVLLGYIGFLTKIGNTPHEELIPVHVMVPEDPDED